MFEIMFLGPSCRGANKITVDCPSVRPSVWHFCEEWLISFSDFWHDGK